LIGEQARRPPLPEEQLEGVRRHCRCGSGFQGCCRRGILLRDGLLGTHRPALTAGIAPFSTDDGRLLFIELEDETRAHLDAQAAPRTFLHVHDRWGDVVSVEDVSLHSYNELSLFFHMVSFL